MSFQYVNNAQRVGTLVTIGCLAIVVLILVLGTRLVAPVMERIARGAYLPNISVQTAYARQLYANLRTLDKAAAKIILVEEVPPGEKWDAVRDRVKRLLRDMYRVEAELRGELRAAGIRMVGPNCMGVLNTDPDVRMNASFADRLPPHDLRVGRPPHGTAHSQRTPSSSPSSTRQRPRQALPCS